LKKKLLFPQLFAVILSLTNVITYGQLITNSVVVGGVTSNSARFWVRLSTAAEINVELSPSEALSIKIKGIPVNTSTESDFAGIVNVQGLLPDTKYYYHVIVNGNVIDSIERYFSTFPLNGTASTFSFAFGSCQLNGSSQGNVYTEIVKHQIKFFLQLGDWGYYDTTDNVPEDNNFFPASYSQVQKTYFYRFDLNYPMDSLLRTVPVDYVYDDHDFMNDNSSANSSSFFVPYKPNPYSSDFYFKEIPNPDSARVNSIRGYKENMPGYPLINESRGIYHKFSYGNIEVFALDLRSQRSPNLEAFIKNTADSLWEFKPSKSHSILGRDNSLGSGENQLDWFLKSLKNSDAKWKFIMSSVPFNIAQRGAIDLGISLQNTVLNIPFGGYPEGITGLIAAVEMSDKWVGFPQDIDTVLNFIAENNIKNVIVLSGDSHNAAIDDGENAGLPEIMAGGLDIPNSRTVALLSALGLNIWDRGGQGLTTQKFNNAFGKVTIFGNDSVNLALIDESGEKFASYTISADDLVSKWETQKNIPIKFKLFQNYPNPFNPSTTIQFSIPESGYVRLSVYNMIGEEVKVLVDEKKDAGFYEKTFDASNLPSGAYVYKLESPGLVQAKKMLLMK
jgi:phosphodiesterase/alkaline phosphatase D-like protein